MGAEELETPVVLLELLETIVDEELEVDAVVDVEDEVTPLELTVEVDDEEVVGVVLLEVEVVDAVPAPEMTVTVLIPKLVTNTSPRAES